MREKGKKRKRETEKQRESETTERSRGGRKESNKLTSPV
jgi:hypothetical protein